MFGLKDKRGKRRKVILGETLIDAQYGVVLAAMDFEWTCRRAILALSNKPTVKIYETFIEGYAAFKGLEKAWNSEVVPMVKGACSLPDLLKNKVSWKCVTDAMLCRNVVVHGTESRVTDKECRWAVCVLEAACDVIATFVEGHGADIFKPINRRRSRKDIDEVSNGGRRLEEWHARVAEQIAKYDGNHWIRTGSIC